ncbi:hypothetical protein CDL12_21052 [Handroanthus impetiginosus]|uniref:Uncharacterized protein n=1 Tax=Handroanthus impetiginosus TaxID=429701 RepID=A0A2G9GMB2_9LAMI|nr:hypothetical protein CDL12_21052 [Handroanthus impetiginosus]
MGRKRKHVPRIGEAVPDSTIAKEDKTSNACPEARTIEVKLDIHASNMSAMEVMNVENKVQANSNGLPPKTKTVVARRSVRLRNLALPTRIPVVNPILEQVNIVENEKEEALNSQQVSTFPVVSEKNMEREPQAEQANTVPNVNERNLEEKIDYLVQAIEEFKTKVFGRPKDDLSYKSLYIDAQKKYERMKDAAGASKEVILVSNLAKATGVTVSLSPQTVQKRIPSAAAAAAPGTAEKPKRNKKN